MHWSYKRYLIMNQSIIRYAIMAGVSAVVSGIMIFVTGYARSPRTLSHSPATHALATTALRRTSRDDDPPGAPMVIESTVQDHGITPIRCGDGARVSGDDRAGSITVGKNPSVQCRIAFSTPRPYERAPACKLDPSDTAGEAYRGAIWLHGATSGETISFSCDD